MNIKKVVDFYNLDKPARTLDHTELIARETAFNVLLILSGKSRLELSGLIMKMKEEQDEVLGDKK